MKIYGYNGHRFSLNTNKLKTKDEENICYFDSYVLCEHGILSRKYNLY